MKPIAIGTDDFKEIIESNSLFIDKTLFIKEIIDDTSEVLLFPRPRRFGKSLNMSMLKYYFDINLDSKYLFKELKKRNIPTAIDTSGMVDITDDIKKLLSLYLKDLILVSVVNCILMK